MGEESYREDDYLVGEIEDAKNTRVGKALVAKNANDLHILVAAQADPRPISGGLEEFEDFRALRNEQDADGMTPIMYAARDLKGDILLSLAGSQVGLKNNDGKTALALFNEALEKDPDAMPVAEYGAYIQSIRKMLGDANAGGRRRRTRARLSRLSRKTRRRQTRRRK
jgi:hypothetical protein